MRLLYSAVHLFIPPPGFRFPLVVLGHTADFVCNIQQRTHQLWPSRLIAICRISTCTSSGDNCSCSSHRFYLEGWLELVSISWPSELPGVNVKWELAAIWELVFPCAGYVIGEVAHNEVVLLDTLLMPKDLARPRRPFWRMSCGHWLNEIIDNQIILQETGYQNVRISIEP